MAKIELDKFLPREIAVLKKISHPNILDVYQIVETEEKCFIVYELALKGTLMEYRDLKGSPSRTGSLLHFPPNV